MDILDEIQELCKEGYDWDFASRAVFFSQEEPMIYAHLGERSEPHTPIKKKWGKGRKDNHTLEEYRRLKLKSLRHFLIEVKDEHINHMESLHSEIAIDNYVKDLIDNSL